MDDSSRSPRLPPEPHALDQLRTLNTVVDAMSAAVVRLDRDMRYRWVSRAYAAWLGLPADAIVGETVESLLGAQALAAVRPYVDRVLAGEAVQYEQQVDVRGLGRRWLHTHYTPTFGNDGVPDGWVAVVIDIDDRRKTEAFAERARRQALFVAQVSAALSGSHEIEPALRALAGFAVPHIADWCAIDVVREDGEIVRVASAHVDPAQPAIVEALRPVHEASDAVHAPRAVMRTNRSVLLTSAAAGNIGFASYLCVPMIAHTRTVGALTLAVATAADAREYGDEDLRFAEDIASRAALAIQHAHAYEQLESANRLKDEFLATLSHELRTPLNAVLGYARMLRGGSIPPDRAPHALHVIERNASALAQIVEDVLDISRIISGKARLHVQAVDLQTVIRDAIETVVPAADAKGVRLQVALDSHAGPVSGDAERLRQVVWNLLSNAVKFTPRGGRVQVRLERVNSHVEIVVSDTGIGIPAAFLPYLFQRFRQAEAGTTRRHGGLGLGLAIVRHLVEMHGGTSHAASDGEGHGATFRVKLPLMIVHAERHPERTREHPRAEDTGATGDVAMDTGWPRAAIRDLDASDAELRGIHVLAVDDDRDALGLVRDILEAAGATVSLAGSALAALDALHDLRPHVLIADLGMPDVDGFELIARVRAVKDPAISGTPAAALTAYARSDDRARSLRAGFGLHLAKPIDPGELIAAVTALARRR